LLGYHDEDIAPRRRLVAASRLKRWRPNQATGGTAPAVEGLSRGWRTRRGDGV